MIGRVVHALGLGSAMIVALMAPSPWTMGLAALLGWLWHRRSARMW